MWVNQATLINSGEKPDAATDSFWNIWIFIRMSSTGIHFYYLDIVYKWLGFN